MVERNERKRWLDPAVTPTTHDPRRIPVPAEAKGPERTLVLRGGRVFPATGEEVGEGTVVVQGNRIVDILAPGSSDWPAEAEVIDVSGKTVLPGLLDLHTHLTYTEPGLPMEVAQSPADSTMRALERLRFFLESGITSIRDAGSHEDIPFRIKAWVSENRLPLPRVFPAGCLITGTGGHGAERLGPLSTQLGKIREASGPDDWRNAVREQVKKGADVIKVASHFTREEIEAAVDEAHTLGLKVMCDAETFYIQWAVEAGVDSIEHPLPRTDETIQLMAKRGTQAVPTLIPYIIIFDQYGGYFGSTSRRFSFSKEDNLEVVRRMREAGVKIGVGTDLVLDWFRYMPDVYIEELLQYLEAGFTAPQALEAATRVNAEILDMGHLLGTVEPGKLADLLVVDGAPDQNLPDLKNVELIIRDGTVVVRDGCVITPRHQARPRPGRKGDAVAGQWT